MGGGTIFSSSQEAIAVKLDKEVMPGSRVKVTLTAESKDVDKVFAKAYEQLRNKGRVPGFRPGKAPNAILKRHYSEELIRELAWSAFLDDIYAPALEDSDLKPIFPPQIPSLDEVENFAEGQPVEIETVLTVHPKPNLPDYTALKLIKARAEVTDEEIDEQLEQLRESYADEIEVERESVAEGDLVRVAMKIRGPDGEIIEETESEFIANRDSDQPVARKLSGHMIGQVVTDETQIAESFDNDELAGQTVTIEATIKGLKERRLPELDDDFASDVDEELHSVEELRARIAEQLAASKRRAAERSLRNMAINLVMQASEIDLPQELIDNVAASQLQSYMQYLQGQGLSAEESVRAVRDDQDIVSNQVTDGLKLHYVFQAIADREQIEITDEDLEAAIPRYAAENDIDEQMVREAAEIHEEMENRLRNFAMQERIIQILLENAEIEEVPWEAYALRAKRHMDQYVEELRQAGKPEQEVEGKEMQQINEADLPMETETVQPAQEE